MPVASPRPLIIRIAVGLTPPGWPPAKLVKLEVVICGPGNRTVRLNETEKLLTDAVITAEPGFGPAWTTTDARPCESLTAVCPFGNVTTPFDVNCTCDPAMVPCPP